MKDGQADFLDELMPEPVAEPVATPTDTPAEPQPDSVQPRNPDGTFANKAPEPAAQPVDQGVKPEAQPAPGAEPPAADDTSPHVPRAALEAERKKRQALEAELAKLKPAASATPPSPTPKGPEFQPPQVDYEQDPRAFVEANLHTLRMQQSRFFAVQQSSETEVDEAWAAFDEACKTDPAVNAWSFSPELRAHPHPIGEVLKWHRRQKQLAEIETAGGLDKLRERWLAEAQANGNGAQPAPGTATPIATARSAAPKPQTPPSLANGGAGAVTAPVMPTEDEDFDGFFRETKTRNR